MKHLKNPAIPGFYPDPSICRVEGDYYIANSSFELFPGIPLFHSTDLMHWEQICNVMTEENGYHVERSYGGGGMMAPTIRYYNGTFYIMCCNFSHRGNFIVTAADPRGPWSMPHWLDDVPGIDASLFFDDDGTAYVVGTGDVWDEDLGIRAQGIWAAKFDIENYHLAGEPVTIFHSAMRGAASPESPHIYHIGSYYYLLIAEGGTDQNHSAVIARSREVLSLYENNPANPVITHRNMGSRARITNVGHADLVETQNGDWYAVMLASRNIDGKHKVLGRETYICPVMWEYDWPFFSPDTGRLEFEYENTGLPETLFKDTDSRDEFDGESLSMHWTFWGTPYDKYYELRDSRLLIRCIPQMLVNKIEPALFNFTADRRKDLFAPFIARRQQSIDFSASCRMHFHPEGREAAGLALVQQMNNQYHFERICENGKGQLQVVLYNEIFSSRPYLPGFTSETRCEVIAKVPCEADDLILKITERERVLTFYYGSSEDAFTELCSGDATKISTEQIGCMTGTMIGMYASGNGENTENRAEFDWFELKG